MKTGFVCGTFDLLHAGHVHLLKECKKHCDYLIVGLHVDPSIERKDKNRPIESLQERKMKLAACKDVDVIAIYGTEHDLDLILRTNDIDIRFLGSDYADGSKPITDEDLIPIKYIESLPIHTTDIRERIKKS